MQLSRLSTSLQKRYPDFDCRVYKFSKFSKMVESFPEIQLLRKGNDWMVGAQDASASLETIRRAVLDILDGQPAGHEWMGLGELGSTLKKKYPEFDCRTYGFQQLSKMLKSFSGIELSGKSEVRRKNESKKLRKTPEFFIVISIGTGLIDKGRAYCRIPVCHVSFLWWQACLPKIRHDS